MARKYASTIQTPEGPRKCFEATITGSRGKPLVARFGGVPLKRQKNAVLIDREVIPTYRRGKQLIGRLLAEHDAGKINHGKRLWALLMFGLWAEQRLQVLT